MISVGFVGVEAFDIILYMGRTLTVLDYQILIVDLSGTDALTKAIYHGMEMDSADDIIHYRSINYLRRLPVDVELNDYKNGVVFVVYGFNYMEKHPIKMDLLYIITDTFPSSIDKINKILCSADTDSIKLRLLVRDIITIDDFERVKSILIYSWNQANSDYLHYDIYDYENALQCQISQVIRFRRISSRMKRIVIFEIGNILSNIKASSIRKAFFCAGKGAT